MQNTIKMINQRKALEHKKNSEIKKTNKLIDADALKKLEELHMLSKNKSNGNDMEEMRASYMEKTYEKYLKDSKYDNVSKVERKVDIQPKPSESPVKVNANPFGNSYKRASTIAFNDTNIKLKVFKDIDTIEKQKK